MPHTEPIPRHWDMPDPTALSHRFCLPEKLDRYTAVTVADSQQGLIFLGNEQFEAATPGLYMVTGSEIHSLAEGMTLTDAGYAPVLPYNARIILFDVRQKLWKAQPFALTASNGETASVNMTLVFRVAEPLKLNRISATPFITDDGSAEIHQDDPVITETFAAAIHAAIHRLQGIAQRKPSAGAIADMLADSYLCAAACDAANQLLSPLGLQAITLYLSSTHDRCPYCQKKLTLPEIIQQHCGTPADPGCGNRLHICPSCQSIVHAESLVCPTCKQELLYCDSCGTYRRLEPGQRFCPVCRRTCYPLLNRELLTLCGCPTEPDEMQRMYHTSWRMQTQEAMQTAGITLPDADAPLPPDALRYLGLQADSDLENVWHMDEEMCSMLHMCVAILRKVGAFSATPTDNQAVLLLPSIGHIYEKFVQLCCYESMYCPYITYTTGRQPACVTNVFLSTYDQGPGPRGYRLALPDEASESEIQSRIHKQMVEDFTHYATYDGAAQDAAFWRELFRRMSSTRSLRNQLTHKAPPDAAREFAESFLRDRPDSPSLLRQLLLCRQITTNFPQSDDRW